MKSIVLQLLASGVALGIMGGSVGVHWLHLSGAQELSESGQVVGLGPDALTPVAPVASESVASPVQAVHFERSSAATVVALEEVISRLQELKSENSHLQEQLQETNRDLNELQFRVDTHSGEFRPMKHSAFGGLLSSPGEGAHPLLPPK